MDYIVGFLLGFFLKDISNLIKRISNWDWENRQSKDWDWISFDRDDLP